MKYIFKKFISSLIIIISSFLIIFVIVSVIDLLEQGIPPEDLEIALEDKMEEFEDDIHSVDYILNIKKVSTDIQSTTDETLKNL